MQKLKKKFEFSTSIGLLFQNVRVVEQLAVQEFEHSPSLDLRKPSRGGEAGDSVGYSCPL